MTGANSGIGEGVAGADVAVNYVSHPEAARRIAAEIAAGGVRTLALSADVSHGQTLFVDGGMTLYPGFAHGG